jgi:serine/threonine protein phosphatase PrpC
MPNTPPPLNLSAWHQTVASLNHPERNEDSVVCFPEQGIFVIADGLSEPPGGEIASRIAATHVAETLHNAPADLPIAEVETMMAHSIQTSNQLIINRQHELHPPKSTGAIGTTLLAVVIIAHSALVANIGNSRLYTKKSSGPLKHLTLDDGPVRPELNADQAMEIQQKIANVTNAYELVTREEKLAFYQRNILSAQLGKVGIQPSLYRIDNLEKGERLLLATDGITDSLTDIEINMVLEETANPAEIVSKLIQQATAAYHEGPDQNFRTKELDDDKTAVLIEIVS